MGRRAKTLAAGLVLVFGTASASLVLGTGAASAAQPVLAGDCGATVQGTPGQPVTLSSAALLSPVTKILDSLPLVKLTLAPVVNGVLAGIPPIPIGTLPQGTGTLSGTSISAPVITALKKTPLAPVADGVGGLLRTTCSVTVIGVNAVAAPIQEGAGKVAEVVEQGAAALPPLLPGVIPGQPGGPGRPGTSPGTNPGGGGGQPGPGQGVPPGLGQGVPGAGAVGGLPTGGFPLYGSSFDFRRSPMADYSSLPFARAGVYTPSPGVRYGGSVPGYTPQFGILGTDPEDAVQAAGNAEALDRLPGDRIAVPVLLAVLALSGVTAALVRTWVLRRTPPVSV